MISQLSLINTIMANNWSYLSWLTIIIWIPHFFQHLPESPEGHLIRQLGHVLFQETLVPPKRWLGVYCKKRGHNRVVRWFRKWNWWDVQLNLMEFEILMGIEEIQVRIDKIWRGLQGGNQIMVPNSMCLIWGKVGTNFGKSKLMGGSLT